MFLHRAGPMKSCLHIFPGKVAHHIRVRSVALVNYQPLLYLKCEFWSDLVQPSKHVYKAWL